MHVFLWCDACNACGILGLHVFLWCDGMYCMGYNVYGLEYFEYCMRYDAHGVVTVLHLVVVRRSPEYPYFPNQPPNGEHKCLNPAIGNGGPGDGTWLVVSVVHISSGISNTE